MTRSFRAPVPEPRSAAVFAELAQVGPYFSVTTGPVGADGWYPVKRLYTDPDLLAAAVDNVRERIAAPDRLVAVSTFFLGFAARLWSIGLGALAGYGLLPDLAPEHLWYAEPDGQPRLHLAHPVAWQGADLAASLADAVLDAHLAPLSAAVRRLGPISEKLLRGNTAAAALGAARVFDRHLGDDAPGPAWQLARELCADERLTGSATFSQDGTEYRRTSCCLYYRTPGGGLCIDCALTRKPEPRGSNKDRKELL